MWNITYDRLYTPINPLGIHVGQKWSPTNFRIKILIVKWEDVASTWEAQSFFLGGQKGGWVSIFFSIFFYIVLI